MRVSRPFSILLLADDQRAHADTIHDHIHALRRYSRHDVHIFNPRGLKASKHLDLKRYDVVVIHYSIILPFEAYLAEWFREQLAAFDGLKVQFVQDEYRWVDRLTSEMRRIGIDILFSLVPESQLGAVYGDRLPGVMIVPTMAGYVPDSIVGRSVPDVEMRPIDVGYRARPIPFWLGRLGQEKIEIGERFLAMAQSVGLEVDLAWSEESRLYGKRWHELLASCRTTLGVESGASIVDHDGSIERATVDYLTRHPTAPFKEVFDAVLAPYESNAVINVISPRVFEATAFGSGLVLYPGDYSGVIEPWTHYIPLQKDFSNLEEVVAAIRDSGLLRTMVKRTYGDLIASGEYSFRKMVEGFDQIIDEHAVPRANGKPHRSAALKLDELRRGRSYTLSHGYVLARRMVHRSKELELLAREPSARRLVTGASNGSRRNLWDDAVRLALLSSAQRGRLRQLGDEFRIEPTWDEEAGRLVLTSQPATLVLNERVLERVRTSVGAALTGRRLREIAWSHVDDSGVLWFRYGPKKLAFEVGQRGTYGVHDFRELVAFARNDPDSVAKALDRILRAPAPPSLDPSTAYGVTTDRRGATESDARS